MPAPCSFTGHPLEGDRIVRMIFFDAAGISNPKHEPYIVVAGIILNADKQWKALGHHLSEMADTFAPPEHRDQFIFHATELFSGGKLFPRDRYTKDHRWNILDELVAVPAKFGLPIAWGRVPRALVERGGSLAAKDGWKIPPVVHGQIMAFSLAAAIAERWMSEFADEDEIAQMIMENDDQSRKFFYVTQRFLSDSRLNQQFSPEDEHFKLSRIIYPMHFEQKTDSSAL